MDLHQQTKRYLEKLCQDIPERCVGSDGNRAATSFFDQEITSLGWKTELQHFEAMDWHDDGAYLHVDDRSFELLVSPYSLACNLSAGLMAASTLEELTSLDCEGQILLLHGELAKEQLMPKNFVFYNPRRHQQIIALLEAKHPAAIISATERSAATAGGVYPFPLIEDGDVDIPSVYTTAEEGQKLLAYAGYDVTLHSISTRTPGWGCNVVVRKGKGRKRIVVSAHIDAKKGTPGAIDNATGVVVLLLLARFLQDYQGPLSLELVALNGEDYYAASGQMLYLANQESFNDILLNINIDGAGYHKGPTSLALFGLSEDLSKALRQLTVQRNDIVEGPLWYQSDHSIFLQQGCPAIAISSSWFIEHINDQDVTHTPKDNLSIVAGDKLIKVAELLAAFLKRVPSSCTV